MKVCECGCGEPTTRSKVAPHDFNRFVYGHNNRLQGRKPEYEVDPITGCWNWVRHIQSSGHGKSHKGKPAHRVVSGLRYGVHWSTIRSVVKGRTWPAAFK